MAHDPTNEITPQPRIGLIPDPNASETAQILGVTATEPNAQREKIDPKWRHLYDQLVRQRDEFIDTIGDLNSKAREVNPDPIQHEVADVSTSSFHRDQLLGMVTLDDEQLVEINDAISRMEAGTYGICEATGQPIPIERLEAIPWARFTAEAQAEFEARDEAPKAALGPKGSYKDRSTAPAGAQREATRVGDDEIGRGS